MMKHHYQRGFMVVSAIILSVIVGLMAASVAYLYTTGGRAGGNQIMTTQALYIAQAGLEAGMLSVRNPTVASRVACASASAGPISFGQGSYTITGTAYTPTQTTLTAAITASSTIIPVASVTGYAPAGFIIVEDEIIDYGSVGTSASACSPSAQPCFLGAVRGRNTTTAAAHGSSARLRQENICQISSVGNVTSGATTLASRTVRQTVQFAQPIAVGNNSSGEVILTWDGRQWLRQAIGTIADVNLNTLSIPRLDVGIGAGAVLGSLCAGAFDTSIIMYNVASPVWTQATCAQNPVINAAINGIFCLSGSACKAAVAANRTFANWNGTVWSIDTNAGGGTAPAGVVHNGVTCTATNNCFAVGQNSGGETIEVWNGTNWSRVPPSGTIANQHLNGVTCFGTTFCTAVGAARTFAVNTDATASPTSWAGATVDTGTVPNVIYSDVSCAAANDCWAVGAASAGANFVSWDGSTWSRNTGLIGTAPSVAMNGVFCADTNNCWAVGALGGAFWNGTTWMTASTGLTTFTANSVHGRAGVIDRSFGWQEVFN